MAAAPAVTAATRNLVVLSVIAAALVAAVLVVGRHEYLKDPPTLTELDPARITHIELDLPPAAAQVFERAADGAWRDPASGAPVDAARVQRLARLAETPVVRWIPVSAVTPSTLGLAPPSATVLVDGVRLAYGGLSALDDLRYVEVGDKVALVPRQYSPEVMPARTR